MRSKYLLLALVATLVIGACGADEDPTIGGDPEATTTTAPDAAPPDGGDEDEDLSALLAQAAEVRVRITYRATSGGEAGEEFTLSQDPPRFALLTDDGKFIVDGDDVVACSDGECMRFPPGMGEQMATGMLGAFTGPVLGLQEAARTGAPWGAATERRQVAGRSALCLRVEPGRIPGVTEQGTATLCADADLGVMLLWELDHEGEVERLEAVEIGDPRDDDFEPDSEPQSMPGG